jgi:oxaloacetate decarboxylase beta subunit
MSILDTLGRLAQTSGFYMLFADWRQIVMILLACILLYLGLVKKFEPLLLIGIAFGMLLTNLPGSNMYHPELWDLYIANGTPVAELTEELQSYVAAHGYVFANDIVHMSFTEIIHSGGLLDILYIGVKSGLYPSLIFMGVGAMTDFGPLLANPKSLLLGAAAQFGIFAAFLMAIGLFKFPANVAASIGIIGGADGPTAIWLTSKLAPDYLAPIAIAAYSYMALIPLIQPPVMRLLTTKKEREIKMEQLRPVSKKQKILFPIIVTIFVCLLLPSVAPLLGCLMLGNLFKECGLTDRLSDTAQNALMNIVTIFLSTSVGATAVYYRFLTPQTLFIIVLGLIAFEFATVGGLLLGKLMCILSGGKINPLIGSAGVSAVPMAARVSQMEGARANPSNFLLMHAMGPNVAGVIGSAVAAGFLLAVFGG